MGWKYSGYIREHERVEDDKDSSPKPVCPILDNVGDCARAGSVVRVMIEDSRGM
jgi:hypothetical protein